MLRHAGCARSAILHLILLAQNSNSPRLYRNGGREQPGKQLMLNSKEKLG